MSANRRHRRSRVFMGRRARRKNTPERRRQWLARRRAMGWFTGRLFVAGDPGEVTYSAPMDPRAPVTYTNTVGGFHSDMVDSMLYAQGAWMRPPLTRDDIDALVGKDRTAWETQVSYDWIWGVHRE